MRIFLFSSLLLITCINYAQSVYFIGGIGKSNASKVDLTYLEKVSASATEDDFLIFLGDNLCSQEFPSEEGAERSIFEDRMTPILDLIKKFPGQSFIIPGSGEWINGSKRGWKNIENLQQFVAEYVEDENVFLPKRGCPGPIEISINPNVVLLILDTQYFLHPWDKPGDNNECELNSTSDALIQLDDLLEQNKNKHVIVVGHHPMYSDGPHGGYMSWKKHLFPFTDINEKLYLPLPIVGSFYPLYRKWIGSKQDIQHPKYKLVSNAMIQSFSQVENLIYLSGHEQSLQYITRDNIHYVVAGSGSATTEVRSGKNTVFSASKEGFGKISYSPKGEVSLDFFDNENENPLHHTELYSKSYQKKEEITEDLDFSDSTMIVPISTKYHGASKSKKFWLGENYRDLWGTPTEVKVFDIGKEHGGLTPIKMGGGNQTKSLRLEDKDGNQFVLRSLDKYTDKLLPAALQRTLASDILQDQISGSNPYGAYAVPPLAEAAQIYHTNPQIVFVPDDPRLGEYRDIFAGLVVLYEERPTKESAGEKHFGQGTNVKGTPDVVAKLIKDNDESIDQPFALRSRLFDMIIGDWDRHEDQWRWVSTKNEFGGHTWRPIPRDRDQAFYVNQGVLGWLASRRFALPNTEGFDERMDYPPGYNTSPRFFDRSFLNSLDWNDWKIQMEQLQINLTDEVITRAFEEWPDTIRDQAAQRVITVLKARRNDMNRFARIHYLFLSQEVEIIGSDKKEHFMVERIDDERTKVTVAKIKKNGEISHQMYSRTFRTEETKEIRLYGLDGEDIFELKGEVNKGIKVRIIGGQDKDIIRDNSKVHGLVKKTVVYDRKKSTQVTKSEETSLKLSKKPEINEFNRTAFKYNKFAPLISVEGNPDDGVFLGAGFLYTKHKWRKEPFASQHKLAGNIALATESFHIYYNGTFSDVIGKWDLNADLSFQRPFGVSNYFGLGNNSNFDFEGKSDAGSYEDPIDFYRIRYEKSINFISLSQNTSEKSVFKIGPQLVSYDLRTQNNKFISSTLSDLDQAKIYDRFQYLGMRADWQVDTRDHVGLPSRGLQANLSIASVYGLNDESSNFTRMRGDFSFFLSTKIPSKVTLANRIGFNHNINSIGDVEFFNGSDLGREQIRGYRRNRFIGESAFFHNVDLRVKLFSFRSYFIQGSFGVLGFHDTGRVWLDDETSDTWHTSKGFGVWLAPLNQVAITFHKTFTDEENISYVSFGYHF